MDGWSCWALPVRGGGKEDLQSHGEAGQLCHTIGHGARGCLQLQEVGDGVNNAPRAEDEEVDPGHCGTGIQQGIDSSEEEEGKDVLHVVAVGPEKGDKVAPSHQVSVLYPIPSIQGAHPWVLLALSSVGWGRHSPQKSQSPPYTQRQQDFAGSLPWNAMLLKLAFCVWDTFAMTDDSWRVRAFK